MHTFVSDQIWKFSAFKDFFLPPSVNFTMFKLIDLMTFHVKVNQKCWEINKVVYLGPYVA
jgi:hypothetical protein